MTIKNVSLILKAYFLGKWGTTALMRPAWSDAKGKIPQPQEAFEPPPAGWSWSGNWEVRPELSIAYEPDDGLNEWTEDIYEHQYRRPFSSWPADESASSWYDVVSKVAFNFKMCFLKPLNLRHTNHGEGFQI